MATAKQLLDLAYSQIGVKEKPYGSNNVIYNTEYYNRVINDPAYAWCAVFIWWLFKHANASGLYYGGKKTASCTTLRNYYLKMGQEVKPGDYKPGDLVFYNWKMKDNDAYHIGIIYETDGSKLLGVIEGNTSKTSDDNGGAVMLRTDRKLSQVINVMRPAYESEDKGMLSYEQFLEYMARYTKELIDAEPSEWSKEARDWAEANNYIVGYGDGVMGYKMPLTREEYIAIEYRQNGEIK